MMLDELKYALLNLRNKDLVSSFTQFSISTNNIRVIYNSIILEGFNDKVLVFYDNDTTVMGVITKLQYLNRKNTLKKFTSVSSAIEYLLYLAKTTQDVRFELYHYFLFRIKEISLNYGTLYYSLTNNFNKEKFIVNCSLSDLTLNGKRLKYLISIAFNRNNICELNFIPENPLWNEGKLCPESDVDKIIDYIVNLSVDKYDDIPLKEH